MDWGCVLKKLILSLMLIFKLKRWQEIIQSIL
jgi:hypothetical protein